jgi:hypothetical protein
MRCPQCKTDESELEIIQHDCGYYITYVCFDCRKTFEREDMERTEAELAEQKERAEYRKTHPPITSEEFSQILKATFSKSNLLDQPATMLDLISRHGESAEQRQRREAQEDREVAENRKAFFAVKQLEQADRDGRAEVDYHSSILNEESLDQSGWLKGKA